MTNTLRLQPESVKFVFINMELMKFYQAYNFTHLSEGFYSNKPLNIDPGGETVYGISRVYHPNLDIWAIVDEAKTKKNFPANLLQNKQLLTKAQVFFLSEFWLKIRCPEIDDNRIQLHLYDCAVNCGQGTSVMFLQQCLGVVADGLLGSITLNAYKNADKDELFNKFIEINKTYYYKKVQENPAKKVNLNGWLERIDRCTKYALSVVNDNN